MTLTVQKYFDYNLYSVKKGIQTALLDVALLMTNVSHLKGVYLAGPAANEFYHATVSLLIASIVVQIAMGILLIYLGQLNINDPDGGLQKRAEIINTVIIMGIFVLTVGNVLISAVRMSSG